MSGSSQAGVPGLADGTVRLRALRSADLDAVVEQCHDEVVQRWSLTLPSPYTRADAEAFLVLAQEGWGSGERWQWAVEVEGRYAGLVDLSHLGQGVREVGFAAHPATRGQGHLTRATRLVVAYAFSAGCPLVLWHAAAGNVASRRVAWHTGFRIAPGETRIMRNGVLRDSWSGTLAPGDPLTPTTRWVRPPPLGDGQGQVGIRLRPWGEDDARLLPGGLGPTPASYDAWHAGQLAREAAGELLSWVVCAGGAEGDPDAVLGGVQLAAAHQWE
ncbi:MAG: GNAT family N-acetyltransferase, partial [Actinomycetota bacterium]|nr:GNAT family N-acetyltransferase [Actinomycetota bacterium]